MLIAFFHESYYEGKITSIKRNFLNSFIPPLSIFGVFILFLAIKSCTIGGKLNEINKEINISYLKNINKIFIILSFILFGIIVIFIAIICLHKKIKDLWNRKNEKKNLNDSTNNNFQESITENKI